MEEATPTPSPPQPTLLYHSTLTSFPSPPSSSLASILLSKPRVLTSIRIIPPSQPAFEYHPSSTQLDEPSPSPFPTTLDLYLNAKYPPSSAPPRSADWKANSLHKISLDLPPYDPIPEAYEFPLPLVEAGAASSLLVFRGSFARLTVSVYGHPSAKSAQEIPEVDWTLYTSLWSRNSSEWETPSLLGVDTSLALLRRLAGDPPLDDGLDHQPVEDGRGGEDEGTNEIEDGLRVNETLLEEEAAGMDVDPSFSEDDNPPTPSASAPPNKRLHILTTRLEHLGHELATLRYDSAAEPSLSRSSPLAASHQPSQLLTLLDLFYLTLQHISQQLYTYPFLPRPPALFLLIFESLVLLLDLASPHQARWQNALNLSAQLLVLIYSDRLSPSSSSSSSSSASPTSERSRDRRPAVLIHPLLLPDPTKLPALTRLEAWRTVLQISPGPICLTEQELEIRSRLFSTLINLPFYPSSISNPITSNVSPGVLFSLLLAFTEIQFARLSIFNLVTKSGLIAWAEKAIDVPTTTPLQLSWQDRNELESLLRLLVLWLESPHFTHLVLHFLTAPTSIRVLQALVYLAIPSTPFQDSFPPLATQIIYSVLRYPPSATSSTVRGLSSFLEKCLRSTQRALPLKVEISLRVASLLSPGSSSSRIEIYEEVLERLAEEASSSLSQTLTTNDNRLFEVELWLRHFANDLCLSPTSALFIVPDPSRLLCLALHYLSLATSALLQALSAHSSLPPYAFHLFDPNQTFFRDEASVLSSLIFITSLLLVNIAPELLPAASPRSAVRTSLFGSFISLYPPLSQLASSPARLLHIPSFPRTTLLFQIETLLTNSISTLYALLHPDSAKMTWLRLLLDAAFRDIACADYFAELFSRIITLDLSSDTVSISSSSSSAGWTAALSAFLPDFTILSTFLSPASKAALDAILSSFVPKHPLDPPPPPTPVELDAILLPHHQPSSDDLSTTAVPLDKEEDVLISLEGLTTYLLFPPAPGLATSTSNSTSNSPSTSTATTTVSSSQSPDVSRSSSCLSRSPLVRTGGPLSSSRASSRAKLSLNLSRAPSRVTLPPLSSFASISRTIEPNRH
jgi:hypothetical protein